MSVYDEPVFLNSGEGCVIVEFADEVDRSANERLQALRRALEARRVRGVCELVAAYSSLAIYFDPTRLDCEGVSGIAREALCGVEDDAADGGRRVILPVRYGGELGPDLADVASYAGIAEEEVVRRHTARECYCYMLGFMPGFPYLGGMDESIATPRLAQPRTRIPAGSIGIADRQTGGYPFDSPGGWRIIGRTPALFYDPRRDDPFLIDAGDRVTFRAIDDVEFARIARDVAAGTYVADKGGAGP